MFEAESGGSMLSDPEEDVSGTGHHTLRVEYRSCGMHLRTWPPRVRQAALLLDKGLTTAGQLLAVHPLWRLSTGVYTISLHLLLWLLLAFGRVNCK